MRIIQNADDLILVRCVFQLSAVDSWKTRNESEKRDLVWPPRSHPQTRWIFIVCVCERVRLCVCVWSFFLTFSRPRSLAREKRAKWMEMRFFFVLFYKHRHTRCPLGGTVLTNEIEYLVLESHISSEMVNECRMTLNICKFSVLNLKIIANRDVYSLTSMVLD